MNFGFVGTILLVRVIAGLLRSSLAIWIIYDDEVCIKLGS